MHNSRERGHFNPNCKYCTTCGRTQLETTLHIFARCPFATKNMATLQTSIHNTTTQYTIHIRKHSADIRPHNQPTSQTDLYVTVRNYKFHTDRTVDS